MRSRDTDERKGDSLGNENVVDHYNVDIVHALLLELIIRLDVLWDLLAACPGERARDTNLPSYVKLLWNEQIRTRRTKTFLPLMPSNVNVLSAASSLTGTLRGMVEPTFASAALRSDVASECAVLVAPDSKEAMFRVYVCISVQE